MKTRRDFLIGLGAAVVLPSLAVAEGGVLSAGQAMQGLADGTLILIDLRTPEEWQDTGVARGAWPLDMTQHSFGGDLLRVIERNPQHQVAVICRTGRRSAYMVEVLERNGIHGVLDVSEGMAGGRNGRGWIPSGLPTVTAEEALARLPGDLTVR
ncbi:rhodanese-like domain-containing protein [Shimia sp.]|uniref:rhodanese-like domain-containing protein n=1 Tax=Shimia sp. TaxID=1954381 RepID=UPI00356A786C